MIARSTTTRRGKEGFFSRAFRGYIVLPHVDFEIPASKTVTEMHFCSFRTRIYSDLSQQLQETNIDRSRPTHRASCPVKTNTCPDQHITLHKHKTYHHRVRVSQHVH